MAPPAQTDPGIGHDGPARFLHWLTVLLILAMYALGLSARNWPMATGAEFAVKATLFSAHKTLGMMVLAVGLLRILRAVLRPGPPPLASHPPLLRWIAGMVHWALYVALVAVPATGWLHHATSTGFAPIWGPFPQTLPLLPRDPALSALFGAMHRAAVVVLAGLALAHAGGALLHHWRDRDPTLMRMITGRVPPVPTAPRPPLAARALPALAIWAAAFAIAALMPRGTPVAELAVGSGRGDWVVEEGELAITVTQLGQPVTGRFARWSAEIAFDPRPVAGRNGEVRVEIDVASLTLGMVTDEVLGPMFLDAARHPVALFAATLRPGPEGGYLADGALTLHGVTAPVRLPFTLELEDGRARMAGRVTLDRRDFRIGETFVDEATVGFPVEVAVRLTARRRDRATDEP
ncbi:MAG: hypothetical protein KatS3mg118_3294 [Paracoccaceae bacterium]|nr:MAG: hypothetical protein KatS3mg118_3294 [Paracoccaceae bacterium]